MKYIVLKAPPTLPTMQYFMPLPPLVESKEFWWMVMESTEGKFRMECSKSWTSSPIGPLINQAGNSPWAGILTSLLGRVNFTPSTNSKNQLKHRRKEGLKLG